MKQLIITQLKHIALAALLAFTLWNGNSTHAQTASAFSYQGRLTDGGALANGLYDLQLALFNSPTNGTPIGGLVTLAAVPVTNGIFTVLPDFGPGAFDGTPRWLELSVRSNAPSGAFTTLSPRQPVLPAPYAQVAASALSVPNASVGGAQLARGSITADKLAPAVAAGLGGVPSGTLVASFDPNATNLIANGFVPTQGLFSSVGGWLETPARNAYSLFNASDPAWTGSEFVLYGTSSPGAPPALAIFNPTTGLWRQATTNGMPPFMGGGPGATPQITVISNTVFVFDQLGAMAPTNVVAGRYNLQNDTWQTVSAPVITNGFPLYPITLEGVVAGTIIGRFGSYGAPQYFKYNMAADSWMVVNTNGQAATPNGVYFSAATETELLLAGVSMNGTTPSPTNLAAYNPLTDTWRPISTNGFPNLRSPGQTKGFFSVWTGTELIVAYNSDNYTTGAYLAYRPSTDTWRSLNTNGAPPYWGDRWAGSFWNGKEVGYAYLALTGVNGGQQQFAVVFNFYNPMADTWRYTSAPNGPTLSTYASSPPPARVFWNGTDVSVFGTADSPKAYRFTPPVTVFFYSKP